VKRLLPSTPNVIMIVRNSEMIVLVMIVGNPLHLSAWLQA